VKGESNRQEGVNGRLLLTPFPLFPPFFLSLPSGEVLDRMIPVVIEISSQGCLEANSPLPPFSLFPLQTGLDFLSPLPFSFLLFILAI